MKPSEMIGTSIQNISKGHFILIIGFLFTSMVYSQSESDGSKTVRNDFQTRTELKVSLEPVDKLTFTVTPELRFDKSFTVQKYLLESKVSYEVLKDLSLAGSYRFIVNPREEKSTELLHRFGLQASYAKKLGRWEPSLRIKYTNYSEDDADDSYFRYRAKLEYDLRQSSLTPFASAEGFFSLSEKEIYKIRYGVGVNYKINKHNSFNISYKLDYYMQEFRNKHILNLGYRYKF